MSINLPKPTLYLITRGATSEETNSESPEFQQILSQVSAAIAAGIELIQLREKKLPAKTLFHLTEQAAQLTRGTGTRLLVNDRADVAFGAGADGVHLTTQSLDAATIRKSFGETLLIGASTHSLEEATAARDGGADFIVFGPVFPTEAKQQFGRPLGIQKLKEATRELYDFPVLALGGISVHNAHDCLAAGAHGIAGITVFGEQHDLSRVATGIKSFEAGHEK
jgi:thiamine-phosphate pyrophosphorylase